MTNYTDQNVENGSFPTLGEDERGKVWRAAVTKQEQKLMILRCMREFKIHYEAFVTRPCSAGQTENVAEMNRDMSHLLKHASLIGSTLLNVFEIGRKDSTNSFKGM